MTEYRGYNITRDKEYMAKRIEAIGRGSVHLSLRGMYTTEEAAKKAINRYEDSLLDKKEEADAKTIYRRRG